MRRVRTTHAWLQAHFVNSNPVYLQFWRQVAPVDENPWLLELVQQHEFRSARGGDGIETVRKHQPRFSLMLVCIGLYTRHVTTRQHLFDVRRCPADSAVRRRRPAVHTAAVQ